jgi:hypothetical protein
MLAVALSLVGLDSAAPPVARAQATAAAPTFATPEAALDALVKAARSDQADAVRAVLGPDSAKLVNSGDPYADAEARARFLKAYDEAHQMIAAGPDRMTVEVGAVRWPLPIPLVRVAGRWHFDAKAGAQELVNRRIGRNEVAAISTALGYVAAQQEFFALTGKDGGKARYARRFLATQGTHDGLYWPVKPGETESPLAWLAAMAEAEGYPLEPRRNRQLPYHGYLFRILTAQGPNTPDGARSYLRGDDMVDGFALVAWPVSYGASGIMTFMVNQDGVIYQKNLGTGTPAAVSRIDRFDPDISWTRVDLTN